MSHEANLTAAHAFLENTWKNNKEAFLKLNITQDIEEKVENYTSHTNIAGIYLISQEGYILYSHGPALSREDFAELLSERSTSDVEVTPGSVDVDDTRFLLTILQTSQPDILLAVASDIGTYQNQAIVLQIIASLSIIVVFLILIWVLLLIAKKAEIIISQQHEQNIELAETAAAAEAENREKSQFLANISHELRTPLNAIIGFSEIIKNAGETEGFPKQHAGYITDIHNSGVHLLSLINDILDYSKAEAGKLELDIEEINASKVILSCVRLVMPRAEAGEISLVNALPKEQFIIETDGKKFKQILLNLLSNAVKFTSAQGKVKVSAWRIINSDTIAFEVSDTGIGMDPKDIAKAMSAFGQVDNKLSRKYEGTGLGLPLTKKFIELMGGTFNITSEPNIGTTVTFTLPVKFEAGGNVIVKRASNE